MGITKPFFNIWYRFFPPEMVSYWKESKGMLARIRIAKGGHFEMEIKGEKYPMKGFPRGYLMQSETGDFPLFSKVKHLAKNLIFNWAWNEIANGTEEKTIVSAVKGPALDNVFELFSGLKYHMLPFDRLVPAVKEFWTGMSAIEGESPRVKPLKEFLSFTMQEDDGYRYRVQWLMEAAKFRKGDTIGEIKKKLESGLLKMADAEVVEDMKLRINLLRVVLLLLINDQRIGNLAELLFKNMDPRKMRLDRGDKYHFRGKYFKVDHDHYEY